MRIGTEDAPRSGSIAVGRERVELLIGERHLPKLDTIVDPLVVSRPGDDGVVAARAHGEGIDALRRLAQIVLIDSQDEPDVEAALTRADDLSRRHLRGRPGVAALDAVARARRGGVRLARAGGRT